MARACPWHLPPLPPPISKSCPRRTLPPPPCPLRHLTAWMRGSGPCCRGREFREEECCCPPPPAPQAPAGQGSWSLPSGVWAVFLLCLRAVCLRRSLPLSVLQTCFPPLLPRKRGGICWGMRFSSVGSSGRNRPASQSTGTAHQVTWGGLGGGGGAFLQRKHRTQLALGWQDTL